MAETMIEAARRIPKRRQSRRTPKASPNELRTGFSYLIFTTIGQFSSQTMMTAPA